MKNKSFKINVKNGFYIGDLCYALFKKYGFTWGGDWKSCKDYQHFEYK